MKRTETVSEWKMVPVEPTDAMLAVWLTENEQSGGASGADIEPWMRAITRYRAMLSAAPQPEQKPVAWVKSSEWNDALVKRQSFNGWRINYGDCDMAFYTAPTDSGRKG